MYRLFYVILFVSLLYIVGCDQEYDLKAFSIGDEFIQSETSVAIVDSYTVNMSTVFIDSIATSGKGIIFAGSYIDDYFGKISSKSYFQIGPPSSTGITTQDRFDSLTLVLKRKDEFYGDTLKPQTINVYRLLEEIELNEDNNLYNTSSFKHSDLPIGSKTFKPWLNKDSLVIRLSDVIGMDFFDKMKSNADEFDDEEEFLDYFKGLVLASGTIDGAILSYDSEEDTIKMVLHTHRISNVVTPIDYTFRMVNAELQFNQITADRTGTSIEELNKRYVDLPSSATGNRSYMQTGVGVMPRLEFPGLQSLLEGKDNYLLVKAELVLKPVPYSYKKVPLPEDLILYESDKYNRTLDALIDDSDNTITATLTIDEVYNEETYYVFDITDFISEELSDAFFEVDHGLLVGLSSTSMGSLIDRVVFDDRGNTPFKPQLKLYFIFYR